MTKIAYVLIAALAAVACLDPVVAHASIDTLTANTGCSTQPSYTGIIELGSKEYDAYVRLAKRGEHGRVTAYSSQYGTYAQCQTLGVVNASGDRWTKVGSFRAAASDTVLELASPLMKDIPSANRPTVMLVQHDTPVCRPAIECSVRVQGYNGVVRPTGTQLNKDSLHVLEVKDPSRDVAKKVRYFVDDQLVYTTPTLQPFDMRYVAYPSQVLTRVVDYASGQQVMFQEQSSTVHSDTFGNFIFRLWQRQPVVLIGIAIGILVTVIFVVALAVSRIFYRRKLWRYNHGFVKTIPPTLLQKITYFLRRDTKVAKVSRIGLMVVPTAVVSLALIIFINSYIAQLFTVDGRSMQHTLKTGDVMWVNKLQKTMATLNGREFVPSRGDIVIVHAVFGTTKAVDYKDTIYLIKRVIALPGERLVIKNGNVTIFNKEHPRGFNPDKGVEWEKTMVGDVASENIDVTLTNSELFISGDNRPESIDSRFNGPINLRELVGVVVAKIWPWN
ncbi:signal peptidase I [Candidatus Saccharibacteria bacterium]|nr:signal peptidase I [Candidatus Saccharibacteria bacterium]